MASPDHDGSFRAMILAHRPCKVPRTALEQLDYGHDWKRAWFECGQAKWLTWFCGDVLGLPVPIAARSCDEIRSRISWEQFRDALVARGGVVSEW